MWLTERRAFQPEEAAYAKALGWDSAWGWCVPGMPGRLCGSVD